MTSKMRRKTLDFSTIEFKRYDDMGGIDYEAYYDGARIGVVRSLVQGYRLHLTALDVVERRPGSDNVVVRFSRYVGILPSRDVRGQGVGTALLRRLLSAAEDSDIREVWGEITNTDLSASPYLLGWYARFGFEILDPDQECAPDSVKKIVRMRSR